MEYNLAKLNDREFEALGASIFSQKLGKRVETFKAGRDEGVDGRFWYGDDKEGIIQCKHYINTSIRTLINKLTKTEYKKVKLLKPKRYFLVVSKQLSRKNKQEIKSIFSPFIKREDDIWGQEDIITFLSKKENQVILEQNYKLWITSASVLEILHNNAIKGRSESTLRAIKDNSYKYAITENHKRGLKILEEKNVVILTGVPGIGKTTLADNLALIYIAKGYEFCDIEENIAEAESLFREKEKKKILFYCDDFLGSNLYDAISNKRDSHIVKFIKRVAKDKSKKFILTSRTNILKKAYSLSHNFQNAQLNRNEFLLKVETLSKSDKAHILYNHIFHSDLNTNYINKIYESKRYRKIIEHRSFNPRIIEFITDNVRLESIPPKKYWHFIHKSLEEPTEIWSDYFQNQLDDCIRAITFLTVFNNGKIAEKELRNAYRNFLRLHTINLGDHSDKSFVAISKLAASSVLNRNQVASSYFQYTLFNPSITDFVLATYTNDIELISNIVMSLETEASLKYLDALALSNKITSSDLNEIQLQLFEYFYESKLAANDWDFLILLSYLNITNDLVLSKIGTVLVRLTSTNDASGSNLSELLLLLSEFEPSIEVKQFDFLLGFVYSATDEDTIASLLNFIALHGITNADILSETNTQIEEYLQSMVENDYIDINFERYISRINFSDANAEIEIDTLGIESEVEEQLWSFLDCFDIDTLEKLNFDTYNVLSNIDADQMAITYLDNLQHSVTPSTTGFIQSNTSNSDDIDAIFERL